MIRYSLQETKVKNHKYYYVYFRVTLEDGTVKPMHKSTGYKVEKGNKRKAEEKAREIVNQYEDLTYTTFVDNTLDKYMKDYLSRHKPPEVKATTYDNYVSMYNKHIQPYFSKLGISLKDLKPMHIQKYINTKLEEVSANTVIKQFRLISQCMQDAVINDFIKQNPCHKVKPPKKSKPVHNWYNEQEINELLRVAKGTEIEVPIFLAVIFGLRRSETIGLKWQDIDFENRTLTINGSVTRAKQTDGRLIDVYNETLKTDASHSTYILDEDSYAYLHNLYEHNMQIISNTDDYKEFVCVNAIGERLKLDYVTSKFEQILKKNNLKHIRFHDLRHSCLSLLANNFSMKQVQAYGRHAQFNITADTYTHVDNTAKLQETTKITKTFNIKQFVSNW